VPTRASGRFTKIAREDSLQSRQNSTRRSRPSSLLNPILLMMQRRVVVPEQHGEGEERQKGKEDRSDTGKRHGRAAGGLVREQYYSGSALVIVQKKASHANLGLATAARRPRPRRRRGDVIPLARNQATGGHGCRQGDRDSPRWFIRGLPPLGTPEVGWSDRIFGGKISSM
jgi:hypothetical protein